MASLDYEAIKRTIHLISYLGFYAEQGFRLIGHVWRTRCPLRCSDDHRSCSISGTRNLWKCHRCGQAGSVIDFHAAVTGLPLYEAALDLCRVMQQAAPLKRRNRDRQRRNRRTYERGAITDDEERVQ